MTAQERRGTLTRRALLGLTVVAAGAVAARWWTSGGSPSRADRRFLDTLELRSSEGDLYREALAESAPAARMASDFGRRYVEARGRPSADTLSTEVMARLQSVRPFRDSARTLDREELERRLEEAIAADFLLDEGVHRIDGWYLSQTECRLAALRHLLTL